MVLEAWIDDCGKKGDAVFALAGFISTTAAWAKFSDEWKRVLDGPSRLDYFKASEADSHTKQFAGWSDADIEGRIDALVEVIKAHVPLRVQCTMLERDYNALIKGRVPRDIDSPYYLCFYQLIISVVTYQRMHRSDVPIQFYFDDQGMLGVRTRAFAWYPVLKAMASQEVLKRLAGEPIFRDDKKFLPLQAADLLAFHWRRYRRDNVRLIAPPSRVIEAFKDMDSIRREVSEEKIRQIFKLLSSVRVTRALNPP